MKTIEKIERRINKLIAENDTAKAGIHSKISKAEADREEAQKALDVATEMNDDVAYHAAKDKIRFATDTIEMCSNKLDVLNSTLCSEEEYRDISSDIKAATIEAEQATEKKLAPLVAEIYKMSEELRKTIDENNALITRWSEAAHAGNPSLGQYFNKNYSEALYLADTIRSRKSANQNIRNDGIKTTSLYDLIK